MPLDLRHVESFVLVAESGGFSTAAERLGTVQSAVSAHVRALEDKVGLHLLDRGRGRGVSVTADGRIFLSQARRLLDLADQLAGPARTGATPRLRLGTTATFALSTVPAALQAFHKGEAHSPTEIKTARSHELLDLLDSGAIDIALVIDQSRRSGRIGTRSVPLAWSVSSAYRTTPGQPYPLAFLSDARDLRRHALAALDRAGIPFDLIPYPDAIGLRAAVAAGLVATVLPAPAIVDPLTQAGPLLEFPPLGEIPISVYFNRTKAPARVASLAEALMNSLE
ncbi:MAG: LysR family transcriptional regulator [Pseudomonadota bacterium]